MAAADCAIDCFLPTAPQFVPHCKHNFHSKAEYWGNTASAPAEALNFLGPRLSLDMFLLR